MLLLTIIVCVVVLGVCCILSIAESQQKRNSDLSEEFR